MIFGIRAHGNTATSLATLAATSALIFLSASPAQAVAVADATQGAATSYSIDEGQSLSLNGLDSTGNGGLTYGWDLNLGNGTSYTDTPPVAQPVVDWATVKTVLGADPDGDYTLGLEVTDGDPSSDTDSATLTITNLAPTADGGGPYPLSEGSALNLDASGSSDPGGDGLLYEWDLNLNNIFGEVVDKTTSSPAISVSWAECLAAGILNGPETILLRVTDTNNGTNLTSELSIVQVNVNNLAPTGVNNGPYAINEGAPVTLSGVGSSDPGNDALEYQWDLNNNGNFLEAVDKVTANAILLVSWADLVAAGVTDGAEGIRFRVEDSNGGASSASQTTITVTNLAPVTNTGGPYAINEGASVNLNAAATVDPGGDAVANYTWDLNNNGIFNGGIDRSTSVASTTVTWAQLNAAGIVDGVNTIRLQTRDTGNISNQVSAFVTTTITVTNLAPTPVDAGGPYAIDEGQSVNLSGSASDPGGDTLAFAWDMNNDADFTDPFDQVGATPTVAFAVLAAAGIADGANTIRLRVTDTANGANLSTTDTTTITVANLAPVADAGGPYAINEGQGVLLDASASSDPGGDSLATYQWDMNNNGVFSDEGDKITLSATLAVTWADLNVAGIFNGVNAIGLRVTDTGSVPSLSSNIDSTTVTVTNFAPAASTGGPYAIDEGESLDLDASASTDPGGDALAFAWDMNNDADFTDSFDQVGVSPTVPFATLDAAGIQDGPHTLVLRVTDSGNTPNLPTTITTSVAVTNLPPVVAHGGPYFIFEGTALNLDASATVDPGDDALSFAWDLDNDANFDGPLDLTGATPTVSWAALNAAGIFDAPHPIGLRVRDSGNADNLEVFATTAVTVLNAQPIAHAGDAIDLNEGGSASLDASESSDPGGDTIAIYSWDLNNNGVFGDGVDISTASPTITVFWENLVAAGILDGPNTIGLRVTDTGNTVNLASETATTTITVTNLAPTALHSGPHTINEGTPVSLNASASTDPGDDFLVFAWDMNNNSTFTDPVDQVGAAPLVSWAELNAAGILDGTNTIGLRVSDTGNASNLSAITTTTISVTNLVPTADAGGPYAIDEGAPVNLDGSASSDPGGDALVFEWDLDNDGTFNEPGDASGQVVSVPYSILHAAGIGEGANTIGLRVTDSANAANLADTDTATLVVAGQPPVAGDDAATVPEDALLSVAAPGVLGNDTDPGLDPLAVSASDTESTDGAPVAMNADGSYTYDPRGVPQFDALGSGETNLDTFTYTVMETGGRTDTATVEVEVSGVNDAPVASNDLAAIDEDGEAVVDVLANDSDVDGLLADPSQSPQANVSVISLVEIPNAGVPSGTGTTTVNPDTGEVTYTPGLNWNGAAVVTYRVTDHGTPALDDEATIAISVAAINDAPDAQDDRKFIDLGVESTVLVDVLENDSDVDGNLVVASVQITSPPALGSVNIDGLTGAITFDPDPEFVDGTDTFGYEVCDDGTGTPATLCSTATVTILVSPSTFEVSTLEDEDDREIGPLGVSLREAMQYVATGGTVTFAPGLFPGGLQTIDLELGQITVTKAITVTGPGADSLAASGGGVARVFDFTGGAVSLSGMTIRDGAVSDEDGAGIRALPSVTLTLDGVFLANNIATDTDTIANDRGGAVFAGGALTLTNSTISGNAADSGGGVYAAAGLSLTNSTVSLNLAGAGGGIFSASGATTIESATLFANAADTGGGIEAPAGTLTVSNSILTGNTAAVAGPNVLGIVASDGINLVEDDAGSTGWTVADLIGDNPAEVLDAALGDNGGPTPTHNLAAQSPAIDSGDDGSIAAAFDQRGAGFARIADGDGDGLDRSDIGAVEFTTTPPAFGSLPVIAATEDVPYLYEIVIDDPDINEIHTITPIAIPAWLVFTDNGDGTATLAGTPTNEDVGAPFESQSFAVEFLVEDWAHATATQEFNVLLTGVNDPPVVLGDVGALLEDAEVAINVLANDSDIEGAMDPASVAIETPAAHGIAGVNPETGAITYTPDADYTGSDSFVYRAFDLGAPLPAQSSIGTVSVTVNPINDAPRTANDIATTPEDTELSIDVLANDVDVDGALQPGLLTITVAPEHGTAAVEGGAITYTPDTQFNGSDSFEYRVFDDGSPLPALSATASVTVNVTATNDPPVAVADAFETNEDTALSMDVLGNDSDIDGALAPGSVAIVTPPAHGTVAIDGAGAIAYTPEPNYNGPDSLAYQVSDTGTPLPAQSAIATVTIQVIGTNDPPVAVADDASTLEEIPVIIPVLANDTDIDGALQPGLLTISIAPAHGTAVVEDGAIRYTPGTHFNGTDAFEYRVFDDGSPLPAMSATAGVIVNVTAANDPPVAVADAFETNEDTAISMNVLANDSDIDGSLAPGSVAVVTPPDHGTIQIDGGTGAIAYTPEPNYNGPDSLAYRVSDTGSPLPSQIAIAVVSIQINAVNDAPEAVADFTATLAETAISIAVLTNDSDADGSLRPETVAVTVPPTHGATTVNTGTGTVGYTPAIGFTGVDSFTYSVSDDGSPGLSANATVTVSVLRPDEPVAASDDAASTDEDSAVEIEVLANDAVAGGALDPGSLRILDAPDHGSIDVDLETGIVIYTPDSNFNGADSFAYQVGDTGDPQAFDTASVAIAIAALNDPPAAVADTFGADEDTPVSLDVLANDSDIDGEVAPESVAIVTPPAHGTAEVDAETGAITYTAALNYSGPDTLSYIVSDTGSPLPVETAVATVSIQVAAANDPPVAVADTAATLANTEITIGVLSNDSDVDGILLPATVAVVATPANGSAIVDPGSGAITYTPANGFTGTDSFTYSVSDDGIPGLSANATVTVIVTPVDDPVVASDDTASTAEDAPIAIPVLANDTVAGGALDQESVEILVAPEHGDVEVDPGTGGVTYTPASNFNGPDSFVYQVGDAGDPQAFDSASVAVTVTPVNDPPVAVADAASLPEDDAVTIAVLANDSDTDGALAPGSVVVVSPPAHGTAEVDAETGAITYTPTVNYNGSDILAYRVSDTGTPPPALTANATMTLNVTPVNDAPVVTAPTALSGATEIPLDIDGVSVADIDLAETPGAQLNVSVSAANGTLQATFGAAVLVAGANGSGTFSLRGTATAINAALATLAYTSDDLFDGADSVTVIANDSGGTGAGGTQSDTAVIALDIAACLSAPGLPTNVEASLLTGNAVVRVTWDAVVGASAYQVFQGDGTFAAATRIATVTGLSADATAPGDTGGCNPDSPANYTYWVRAINDCGNGGEVEAATDFAKLRIFEPVFGSRRTDDGMLYVNPDSALAIRLMADDTIDPESVWGAVTSSAGVFDSVEWQAINDADGWAVFSPADPWEIGDMVTMTAGAATLSGAPVGPFSYTFLVAEATDGPELLQPLPGKDYDTTGLEIAGTASLVETAGPLPSLDGGLGGAVTIGPDVVFEAVRRVWLAVPADADASDVDAYYLFGDVWYPVGTVEGFLAESEPLLLEVDGVTYLGLAVNHAGTVQLATRPSSPDAAAIVPSAGPLGDLFLLAVACMFLIAAGHRGLRRA